MPSCDRSSCAPRVSIEVSALAPSQAIATKTATVAIAEINRERNSRRTKGRKRLARARKRPEVAPKAGSAEEASKGEVDAPVSRSRVFTFYPLRSVVIWAPKGTAQQNCLSRESSVLARFSARDVDRPPPSTVQLRRRAS